MQNNNPKVKSLYKALKLLEYFDETHKEAGVTELAEYSGMLKSSVHNILQTLEICGYVTQNSATSKYMLGGTIVSLFSQYKVTRKLDYRITEYLQNIRNKFEVNAYLGVKEHNEAVYLCSEQAFFLEKDYLSKEGARVPLHCTSIGKILLGFSTVSEKEEFYQQPLATYTEHTITDIDILRKQIDTIIYNGYATADNEYISGMYCLAVPVIIGGSDVQYAVGIASNRPFSHYMLKQYLAELQDMSRKIAGILVS